MRAGAAILHLDAGFDHITRVASPEIAELDPPRSDGPKPRQVDDEAAVVALPVWIRGSGLRARSPGVTLGYESAAYRLTRTPSGSPSRA